MLVHHVQLTNPLRNFHNQHTILYEPLISFVLLLQFFQRNGQPYPICDKDQLMVDVSESDCHRRVATVIELGGTEPNAANTAVVKFTVRHAGQYNISILISNSHINGSPFTKTFLPGELFVLFFFLFLITSIFFLALHLTVMIYFISVWVSSKLLVASELYRLIFNSYLN